MLFNVCRLVVVCTDVWVDGVCSCFLLILLESAAKLYLKLDG